MQVTSSTSSQALAANTRVGATTPTTASDAGLAPEPSTKVTLSDEGLQKSAQALAGSAQSTNSEDAGTQDAGTSGADAANATGSTDSTSSTSATDPADAPSSLKSVTYGVLGLPDPSKPPPTNTAFGVGKCFAAVGTVVSTIMLALKFL